MRATSASIAGASPSSSSAAGRSSVMIARRFSISRSTCPTPSRSSSATSLVLDAPQRRGEDHPQPAEPLQRLVVQLARPAPALGLGRLERVAQPLVLHGLRERDGGRGAGGERAQRRLVVLGEALRLGAAVERREHAEPAAAVDERREQRRLRVGDAELRGGDAQVRADVGDPLDGARLSTCPVVDPLDRHARAGRPLRSRPALAATTRSGPSRSRITRLRASTSARPRLAISSSTCSSSISAPTATAIVRAASRRRADCSSSSRRAATASYRRAFSIAIAAQAARITTDSSSSASNSSPPCLLGQVEVAPDLAAHDDRHAEEARHRRMAGRKAVGLRVIADAGMRSGCGLSISTPRMPRPRGRSPIDAVRLGVDPARDEALELAPVAIEDARARRSARR